MVSYQRRPNPYYKASVLNKKINKLSCCVNQETHHKDTIFNATTAGVNTTQAFPLFNTIAQGDSNDNRTGVKISVRSIELRFQKPISSSYPGDAVPIEFFLVRPVRNGTAPIDADFSVNAPGSFYIPENGWSVCHLPSGSSANSFYYKRVNLKNMKVEFNSGIARTNNLYLVIRNYSSVATEINGTVRVNFIG